MTSDIILYPLKFQPIFKEKVWGGNKLNQLLNKETVENTGESWEISSVAGDISTVENGHLKGKSLSQIISQYKEKLLGKKVYKSYGKEFPLLFKFIDARENLSVQLHPNDALAKERHGSFGKTEMWYILQANENAQLILDFNQKVDEAKYQKMLVANKITEILNSETVQPGDAFFIAPGTVHAIGSGVLLAEIQQTSDITYRIYDWDRPDSDGKMRDLHTDLALRAINYQRPKTKLNYEDIANTEIQLCKSEYFITNKLNLTRNFQRNSIHYDSFLVYMCIEGKVTFKTQNISESIRKGQTLLIPASLGKFDIKTDGAVLLEVYIP